MTRASRRIPVIDDHGNVQILVGVDTTDDVSLLSFLRTHPILLAIEPNGFTTTGCADRTVTRPDGQALLGSQASAR